LVGSSSSGPRRMGVGVSLRKNVTGFSLMR